MEYKVGDIIKVKVSVVNIDENGDLECCHVGCEKEYPFDTDTMFFNKEDVASDTKMQKKLKEYEESLRDYETKLEALQYLRAEYQGFLDHVISLGLVSRESYALYVNEFSEKMKECEEDLEKDL